MTSNAGDLLDVVDAHDRVIGVATRAQVHADHLYHRAVHIVVHDAAGRIYVQRRSELKDCAPGLWDTSAAGHVGHGEDYVSAAMRELAEELGLRKVALASLGAIAASADTGFEFVQVFVVEANDEPVPDPEEIAEARWCGVGELAAWIAREPQLFTASFRHIFASYRERAARIAQGLPV